MMVTYQMTVVYMRLEKVIDDETLLNDLAFSQIRGLKRPKLPGHPLFNQSNVKIQFFLAGIRGNIYRPELTVVLS
jgi:hypothetical protein